MKLVVVQFSVSCYFLLLVPDIFLVILFSYTHSLLSSLNVKDHISDPYKNKRQSNRSYFLDFKLTPCFESCLYSFGYFPGV